MLKDNTCSNFIYFLGAINQRIILQLSLVISAKNKQALKSPLMVDHSYV